MVGVSFMPLMAVSSAEQIVTWNPSDAASGISLSNGNLDAEVTSGSNWRGVRPTAGFASGKRYFELLIVSTASSNTTIGLWNGTATLSDPGRTANGRGIQSNAGGLTTGWTAGHANFSYVTNDVIGFAFDMSTGNGFVSKNGVWQSSSDPVAQTTPWVTGLNTTVYAGASFFGTSDKCRIRTKNSEFSYSPPSGYLSYATP